MHIFGNRNVDIVSSEFFKQLLAAFSIINNILSFYFNEIVDYVEIDQNYS